MKSQPNLPPTPEQIKERAAAIRETWSEKEKMIRQYGRYRRDPIRVKMVSVDGINPSLTEGFQDELCKWPYLNDAEVRRDERRRSHRRHRHEESELEALDNEGVDDSYVEAVVVEFGQQVS